MQWAVMPTVEMMEKAIVRQFIIEYLENYYQQPYTDTCLGGDFDLTFISEAESQAKFNFRAVWVAYFFLDLTDLEEAQGTKFFPTSVEVYLDDKTGEIWRPPVPHHLQNAQARRNARKERRQLRRNQSYYNDP
jgi:hypothetical protein